MKLVVTIVKEAAAQAPLVLRGNYADCIHKAAQIGYDAVELHVPDSAEVNMREVRAASRRLDCEMSSIGTGLALVRDGLSLTSRDEDVATAEHYSIAGFHPSGRGVWQHCDCRADEGPVKESPDRTEYERNLTEALDACLPVARESGVTLVLEAMNRYESDTLNTIEECVRYYRKV